MVDNYTGEEKRHIPRTPVSEISYQRFGLPTAVRQTTATVGTAVTEAVQKNSNRISVIMANTSDTVIYIGFVNNVSSQNGLPLAANGGTFSMNINDEGEAVSSSIYAVCSVADKLITVIETIVEGR